MLTMIDESNPWTVEAQRKYQLYAKLRKERDKFIKSLREKRHSDWLIEKKLLEAGGLGDTVYILPARGGGTSFRTLRRINELLEEGRDVTIYSPLTYNDWKKRGFLLNPTYGITYRKGVKE